MRATQENAALNAVAVGLLGLSQLDGTGYFLLPLVTCVILLGLWIATINASAGRLSERAGSQLRPANAAPHAPGP